MLMPMLSTAPLTFASAFLQPLTVLVTGSAKFTFLQKIYPGAFSGLTGTKLKIVIQPPTSSGAPSGSLVITAAYVGFPSGGPTSTVSFDGAQVPLTWDGGQPGGTFTAGTTQPEPDEINFAVPDLTKALLFAFDVAASSKHARRGSLGANYQGYSKNNVEEAANTTKSGYTPQTSGFLNIFNQLLIGS